MRQIIEHRKIRLIECQQLIRANRRALEEIEEQLTLPDDPFKCAESFRRELITQTNLAAFVADQLNEKVYPSKYKDMIPNSIMMLLMRAEEGCVQRDLERMQRFGTTTPVKARDLREFSRRRVRIRIFRWVRKQAEKKEHGLSTEELHDIQSRTLDKWDEMTPEQRDEYLNKEMEIDQARNEGFLNWKVAVKKSGCRRRKDANKRSKEKIAAAEQETAMEVDAVEAEATESQPKTTMQELSEKAKKITAEALAAKAAAAAEAEELEQGEEKLLRDLKDRAGSAEVRSFRSVPLEGEEINEDDLSHADHFVLSRWATTGEYRLLTEVEISEFRCLPDH